MLGALLLLVISGASHHPSVTIAMNAGAGSAVALVSGRFIEVEVFDLLHYSPC